MVNKKTKILFLTQTNEHGAASRYRVYQYLEYLRSSGFIPVVSSGLPGFLFGFFYKRSNILKKLICLPLIIIKRIADLSRVRKFDIVFIQRDIIPHCYPLFEMLISRMNKNIVFDFDDAIFTANPENSRFLKKIRYKKAVERIIKKSRAVIAGNDFLRQYALKFNKNVYLLPTSVDTQRWNSKTEYPDRKEGLIIGWIGQEYTLFYLDFLKPVFKRLSSEFDFCLHIVGAGFDYGIEGVRIKNISWDYSSEVDLVREFDVGVAPLSDDEWARGKCGLKALLYIQINYTTIILVIKDSLFSTLKLTGVTFAII